MSVVSCFGKIPLLLLVISSVELLLFQMDQWSSAVGMGNDLLALHSVTSLKDHQVSNVGFEI